MDTTTNIDGKATIEVFQNGGADETLDQAKAEFEKKNPGTHVLKAEFEYAYPGEPGKGRWVGIGITYTMRPVPVKSRINGSDRPV